MEADQRTLFLHARRFERDLNERQRAILARLARGETNAQIAENLYLSVNTVEWHLRGAYETLGVRSRTGLLAKLFNDLAPPGLLEADTVAQEDKVSATRQ